jgi:RNA polymerase sigma factor (TIGR02999 family)
MTPSAGDVTRLLNQWAHGDPAAFDQLLPLVYRELRKIAKRYMHDENGHTLQSTALVHEAYLKLVDDAERGWGSRAHFFAVAAKAMRQVVVDHARSSLSKKRGGHIERVDLEKALAVSAGKHRDLLVLNDALMALAALDPRKGQIVELRYFAGLSTEETAQALNISPKTVTRDWALAKAFLKREIQRGSTSA